jgi:hypothetical protein
MRSGELAAHRRPGGRPSCRLFCAAMLVHASMIGCGGTPPPTPDPVLGEDDQPPDCRLSLDVTPSAILFIGGQVTVKVTVAEGCVWAASVSDAPWLMGATASGNGSGQFNVSASSNLGPSRTATITVNDVSVAIVQNAGGPACTGTVNFSPGGAMFTAFGSSSGSGFSVDTEFCPYTLNSNVSWISLARGPGFISMVVSRNTGGARIGTVTIGTDTATVAQSAAGASCSFLLSATSQAMMASGGQVTVSVTSGSGCAWAAWRTIGASWVTFDHPPSGIGNGSVSFTVAPNAGGARQATLSIAGVSFSLTQS